MGDFQRIDAEGLLLVKGVRASPREKIPQCDSPVYDRNKTLVGTVCDVAQSLCTYVSFHVEQTLCFVIGVIPIVHAHVFLL